VDSINGTTTTGLSLIIEMGCVSSDNKGSKSKSPAKGGSTAPANRPAPAKVDPIKKPPEVAPPPQVVKPPSQISQPVLGNSTNAAGLPSNYNPAPTNFSPFPGVPTEIKKSSVIENSSLIPPYLPSPSPPASGNPSLIMPKGPSQILENGTPVQAIIPPTFSNIPSAQGVASDINKSVQGNVQNASSFVQGEVEAARAAGSKIVDSQPMNFPLAGSEFFSKPRVDASAGAGAFANGAAHMSDMKGSGDYISSIANPPVDT
jgi:hypothetical protein